MHFTVVSVCTYSFKWFSGSALSRPCGVLSESLEIGVWILTLLSGSVSVQCRDLDTHAQFCVFCCKHMVWVFVSGLVLYVFVEHLLNV